MPFRQPTRGEFYARTVTVALIAARALPLTDAALFRLSLRGARILVH